jgi:hypothetical protein
VSALVWQVVNTTLRENILAKKLKRKNSSQHIQHTDLHAKGQTAFETNTLTELEKNI